MTVSVPTSSGDDLRKSLRRKLQRYVNAYCRSAGATHKDVHYRLNSIVGGNVPTASVEQLEKRIEVIRSWQ